MKLNIQDTFNRELPADPILENSPRKVKEACYSFVHPQKLVRPKLIHVSQEMAAAIGISKAQTASADFLQVFSGNQLLEDSHPYAMCYGGHQFGHWAGQLGDGRAINLAEIVHENQRWALQLKGAGPTPYSRTADGLAVLRSSIREHLCSEAMHHLGVPTTRSLSLILSGQNVLRDVMYDGNSDYEKGAVVCRLAPSFIRFGNFQLFTARGDVVTLRKLTNYTIRHFFPTIKENDKAGYIQFFKEVSQRTLDMIIHWQRVGFVHGVMNTDNLSILGLTIDYGPYGWLEGYDANWTPNTTDKGQRRYRYGHQPQVALWNLIQLANALYPLIEETAPLEEILNQYKMDFALRYFEMMSAKIGLSNHQEKDQELIRVLEETLQLTETDMTIFFRKLSDINKGDDLDTALDLINSAFYLPAELTENTLSNWKKWLNLYLKRLEDETTPDESRKVGMNTVNPKYVLRNYMAQLAIDAADKGDYSVIDELHNLLKQPYAEQVEMQKWFAKRPEWARHKVGCSMLSCSS